MRYQVNDDWKKNRRVTEKFFCIANEGGGGVFTTGGLHGETIKLADDHNDDEYDVDDNSYVGVVL